MRLGFLQSHKRLAVRSGAHGGDFSGPRERVFWSWEDVGSVFWGVVGFGGVDEEWFGGEDGFILRRVGDCAGCGGCVVNGLKMLHDLGVFGRIGRLSFREEVQELYSMYFLVKNILSQIHDMITYLVTRRHGRIYKSEARIP